MSADFINDPSSIMEEIKKNAEEHNKKVEEETQTDTETTTETAETKKEETTEEKKDDVHNDTETKDTETQEKKVDNPDDVKFDVESFNREFKTEYKTSEEITSLFESSKQLEELRASLSEKDKLILEKEELLNKKTDGLKLFANEKMYKINQILINNPDLNEAALTKLASADLDNMKDLEVLKLNELMKSDALGYDEATIEYAINKKYGLTGDPSDLEGDELREYKANEYNRNKDARLAKAEMKKLLDVAMPEKIDLLAMENDAKVKAEEAFKTSLESWKVKSKEVVDKLDKYVVEYDKDEKFEFDYGDEFKAYLNKNLPEFAARSGFDASNPESLTKLVNAVKNDFRNQKEVQMFKAFKEDLLTKWKDEDYRKKHNVPDPKTQEAPDALTDIEKKNQAANEKIAAKLGDQKYF